MPETQRWRKVFAYYDEPGARDMIRLRMHETIKKAKDEGKIQRIIGEPTFTDIATAEEGYFQMIVSFEFVPGETLDMKKAPWNKYVAQLAPKTIQ